LPARLALHEIEAVPDPVILLGDIALHARPVGSVSLSVATPEKPFRAVVVIVETTGWPTSMGDEADTLMVKSGNGTTLTVTVVLWARLPPVPVRVTV